MKRIVIDARIIDSSTGVYIQRLLHFLHKKDLDNEYIILIPSKNIAIWRKAFPKFRVLKADQVQYTFAEQLSLAWKLYRLKPDLVHFCMTQQPVLWFGRRVTTIHDTTLLRFDNIDMNPLVYKVRKLIFGMITKNVIKRSKAILVPTNFVKNDLVNYMHGRHSNKIVVTLLAGDPVDAELEVIKKLAGKQYVAFVGNAFPYKNIGRIIEAYAEIKKTRPELHLALAGKKDYFYDQLAEQIHHNEVRDVHFLGFISHGEKRWLYQNAQAFVTASLSEGFCIPLLEAMYEGCPVISSDASCLPEVAGRAARYFDPYSTSSLVKAITQVLDDKELRDSLVEAGNERVKDFSWQRMADETYDIYQAALQTG